jgi:hypothetical protein
VTVAAPPPRPSASPLRALVPVTLVALSIFIAEAQETIVAIDARSNLIAAAARQKEPFKAALTLRDRLDALAADTAKLAQDGDPAAKAIAEALKSEGITLPNAK